MVVVVEVAAVLAPVGRTAILQSQVGFSLSGHFPSQQGKIAMVI